MLTAKANNLIEGNIDVSGNESFVWFTGHDGNFILQGQISLVNLNN